MNLFKISLLILGMHLWVCTGFGQEKSPNDTLKLSLSEAIRFATENNQSILNANLDVESAKKKVWETTTIGLPQVNGKLAFSYTPLLSSTIEKFGAFAVMDSTGQFNINDLKWSLNGTITATQLIFSGSYLVGLQSAKVYKSLSELNQTKSRQDIIESITNSYFNVLIAKENRLILDSTFSNLQKTLADMQVTLKQGLIEETDVDQMQITVSNVKTSLDLITRMEDISEKALKLQLGIALNFNIALTDKLDILNDFMIYDKLIASEFILENNVNYRLLDTQVKTSELLLKLRKSEFLPDLAAFYQGYKEFNNNAFSFNPPHVLGLTLNVPIFGSGAKMSRLSQAKIDVLKAKNTKEQVSNSLWLDYYNSRSALINAHDRYLTEKKNLELSRKIYSKALIKYTNGIISNIDLTQIQNQYLTSQSNYYTSLQELISSRNKLENLLTNANK